MSELGPLMSFLTGAWTFVLLVQRFVQMLTGAGTFSTKMLLLIREI